MLFFKKNIFDDARIISALRATADQSVIITINRYSYCLYLHWEGGGSMALRVHVRLQYIAKSILKDTTYHDHSFFSFMKRQINNKLR